tara:strand:- start:1765 stop:2004 length:240 start_codon:yes stop_codon:yes gene_type:complete
MVTLKQTLQKTLNWSNGRIKTLCSSAEKIENPEDYTHVLDNAYAIRSEFSEWLEPDLQSDVLSLEYIEDFDNGVDIIEI